MVFIENIKPAVTYYLAFSERTQISMNPQEYPGALQLHPPPPMKLKRALSPFPLVNGIGMNGTFHFFADLVPLYIV
ncbi:MAG: hypothetical protein C4586_00355 [Anaerolineaceae bacterium]|nr:MAG: hypothetical protein C4586_00355 [Anaerolineaceae bacterium]